MASYKFFPNDYEDRTVNESIQSNFIWLYADVTCPRCGKDQPVSATQYVGGPCVRCGELTGGHDS